MKKDKIKSKEGFVSFLRGLIGHLKITEVLFLELESLLLWLFNSFPCFLGFALRSGIYKLLLKELGGFAWIQSRVTVVYSYKLKVGKFFAVNSGTYINAMGGITIGDHVVIGPNVTISSGKHPIEGKLPPIITRPSNPLPIIIEDDVWIGAGAAILPGITLKKGTVVGANSVVTRDTEEYSVVVGAPARKVRLRFDK
jgi:maltose O-acetyltransferase